MPRYSEEVINYAKELYLTVDEKGNRIHSLQSIAKKLQEERNTSVNPSTILRWARKYGWDSLLEKAAKVAVVEAARETGLKVQINPGEKLKEEQILESVIALKKEVFAYQLEACQIANELLRKKRENPSSVKDSYSRLIEVSSKANKTLQEMLDGIEQQETATVQPVIIINEIGVGNGSKED